MVPPAPWSKDVFSGRAGGRQGSYARQALGGRQSDAGKSREKALGHMKPVWSVGQSGQARIKSGGPGLILGRPPRVFELSEVVDGRLGDDDEHEGEDS